MKQKQLFGLLRRAEALLLSAAVLALVAVTAGSQSPKEVWGVLQDRAPLYALRWALADWAADGLSPETALIVAQSPLLLSSRGQILNRRSFVEPAPPVPAVSAERAPEAAPPDPAAEAIPDNGVAARTLLPTDLQEYTVWENVCIKNTSGYEISPDELGAAFSAALGREGPQILILHTHGSEAYTPAGDEGVVWSGHCRTTDCRYNVVAVGDAMAEAFADAGISVLHDRTLYDYPSYSGAYDRSLTAAQSYLDQYPSISFILDVHRDAIEGSDGTEYKVIAPADGQQIAQLSLVVGSSGGGLEHSGWRENLKLAAALQQDLLNDYPALMRPLLLRASRYNQHLSPGSLLVEVGAAGNSPEEACASARLFAGHMAALLLSLQEGS